MSEIKIVRNVLQVMENESKASVFMFHVRTQSSQDMFPKAA